MVSEVTCTEYQSWEEKAHQGSNELANSTILPALLLGQTVEQGPMPGPCQQTH